MYNYMIIYDIMIYHVLSCTVYLKQMPWILLWLVSQYSILLINTYQNL